MDRRIVLKSLGVGAAFAAAPRAFAQDGAGRWLRLESQHFVYYSSADEKSARGELAALEGFHDLLGRLMPHDNASPVKLTVYATLHSAELQATSPGIEAAVAGFYRAGIEEIVAVTNHSNRLERQRSVPRNVRALDARTVLFHEYAHHYMRANDRLIYPSWYVEGFAEFLSTAEFLDEGLALGKVALSRADTIVDGDWMALETILTKARHELSTRDQQQFYSQAWLIAHFLFSTPERSRGFDRYVRALSNGGDVLGSFEPAFGITTAAFDQELRTYQKGPIKFWTLKEAKVNPTGISSSRLDRAADDLLLPTVFLRSRPGRARAADTVAKAREIVAKFSGNAYAEHCGALVDVWFGDLGAARTRIDALLEARPGDAGVIYLSGLCDLRVGGATSNRELIERARKAFGRAYNLDPARPQSLYRYVEAGLALDGDDPHHADALVMTWQAAPQIDEVALTTAQALIGQQRLEEAITVLQPLTTDVHGGDVPAIAREILAEAKAGKLEAFRFFGAASAELA